MFWGKPSSLQVASLVRRIGELKFLKVGVVTACWFCACAQAADTVVIRWSSAALEAIRETHMGPPQAARALAMVHTCIYDAWVPYDPVGVGTHLPRDLRRPAAEATKTNKTKAISFAAFRCLVDVFPRQRAFLQSNLAALGYDPSDASTDITTPAGLGNVAAAAVIESCHHDGSNQLGDLQAGPYEDYTGYVPINGPDRINDPDHWQPLRVIDHGDLMIQRFVAPFWNRVAPFALRSAEQFRPDPPYSYRKDREKYIQQAIDLISISGHLTERQKVIADYWADGIGSETPTGHWCRFAQFISRRDHHSLDADVKMFFALTNALFDASIATWDAKRAYDSVRPITAIHFLFASKKIRAWAGQGKGTEEMDGGQWKPYQESGVVTPSFPEYPSGHSAFSAAAAEVLRRFTGTDSFEKSVVITAGISRIEPGAVPAHEVRLSWSTISDAANEAGMSRRYGGIHFELGDIAGRRLGRQVGFLAYQRAQQYFRGTVPFQQ